MEVRSKDGKLRQRSEAAINTICTNGETYWAGQLDSGTQAASLMFGYIGIGTTNTAPTTDDTALANETGTRQQTSAGGRSASGRVFTQTVNFASDNPAGVATIREAGIFQTNTAGAILSHVTFSDVNKAASDNINITYDLTI
jgi:hypothetical protein